MTKDELFNINIYVGVLMSKQLDLTDFSMPFVGGFLSVPSSDIQGRIDSG